MSFYGSTYYQLVDTFYKILIKNQGNTAITVSPAPNTNEFASQASGRKGILEFGTGNRWIYATQDETNPNSYIFWHAAPGGETLTTQEFRGGLAKDDIPAGAQVITLEPDTYIKAPCFKFDEAGHIAVSDDLYYKMPISETEQAIEDLQEKVGEPATGGAGATGLFLAVDETNLAVDKAQGDTDKIRAEIGELGDALPVGQYLSQTFFGKFGNLEEILSKVMGDEADASTFRDAFLAVYNQVTGNTTDIGNNATLLTYHTTDIKNLQDSVAALEDKDTLIDADIEAVNQRVTDINTAIRADFKTQDDSLNAKLEAHTTEFDTRIDSLSTVVDAHKVSAEAQFTATNNTISANQTANDSRMSAIEENATRLEGLITSNDNDIASLSKEVGKNKTAAETAASGLSDRITALENDRVVTEELNEVIESVATTNDKVQELGTELGELTENTETGFDAANKRIDTVATNAIGAHERIDAIGTRIDTLSGRMDTFDTNLTTKADKTELANYATAEALNQTNTKVSTLETALSSKVEQSAYDNLTLVTNAKADKTYVDEKIAELLGTIQELTARIEALENANSQPEDGGETTE